MKERETQTTNEQITREIVEQICDLTRSGKMQWDLTKLHEWNSASAEYNGLKFSLAKEQDIGPTLFVSKPSDIHGIDLGWSAAKTIEALVYTLARKDPVLKSINRHRQTMGKQLKQDMEREHKEELIRIIAAISQ